jgi:hypothetical protein
MEKQPSSAMRRVDHMDDPTTTHTVTVHVDISVELESDRRPEELVVSVGDYVGALTHSSESAMRGTIPAGARTNAIAKMTAPLKVTGVLVRDSGGETIVQSGSAIPKLRRAP